MTSVTADPMTGNSQEITHINHLAFVDDTAWIANSHDSANKILAIADDFFRMNDILINTQKTETLVVKGSRRKNSPCPALTFGEEVLHISGENTPHRYLSIWIAGSLSTVHTVNRIMSETNTIYNAIQRKNLTDKQTN